MATGSSASQVRRREFGVAMQHTELLSTLAEVSIVFAGLTGVVGMLGFRSDNPALHGQLYQIGAMIGFSLIAALFSILPLLLSAVGLPDTAAFKFFRLPPGA